MMSDYDREHRIPRAEFDRVVHRCPCQYPNMMSYDELMGAFKEAIRQRDEARKALAAYEKEKYNV